MLRHQFIRITVIWLIYTELKIILGFFHWNTVSRTRDNTLYVLGSLFIYTVCNTNREGNGNPL